MVALPLPFEDDAPHPDDALSYAVPLGDYDIPSDPHFPEAIYAGPFYDADTGTWYRPRSPRTLRPCAPEKAWAEWAWTQGGGGFWDFDNQALVEGPNGPLQRLRDGRARQRSAARAVDTYIHRRGAAREGRLAILVWAMFFGEGLRVTTIAARLERSSTAVLQIIRRLCISAGAAELAPTALRPRHPPRVRAAARRLRRKSCQPQTAR